MFFKVVQIVGNVVYDFKLLKAVIEVKNHQRLNIIGKLTDAVGNLKGKTIGVWGFF
jgi:UDPglucose 6-dehydrogenase